MPDELIPGTKRTVAYKKPAAGKYIAPDNAMAANMAAQRNVMPNQSMANTNQPPIMKKGPFKMNYKNSSFPFKSSPATKRSMWQKAKDEAGQLYQGAKALVTAESRGIEKAKRAYLKQEQKDRDNT